MNCEFVDCLGRNQFCACQTCTQTELHMFTGSDACQQTDTGNGNIFTGRNDVHIQGFSVFHGYMNKKTTAVCIGLDF